MKPKRYWEEHLEILLSMRDGVITDFDVAEEMIKHFIKAHNHNSFFVRELLFVSLRSNIS